MNSRSAWSTKRVPGQSELHRKTLSQKRKERKEKNPNKQTIRNHGAGETAQQVRVLAVRAEERGSVPGIHMAIHSCWRLHFHGIQCPPMTSMDTRHKSGAQIYMEAKHSYT